MMRFITPVLDILLPPSCLCCEESVVEQGQVCAVCFGRLPIIAPPGCERCGMPFASAGSHEKNLTCRRCAEAPPLWHRAVTPFRYEALAKDMVLQLKHGDRIELARWLADQMARAGDSMLKTEQPGVIAPTPLHRRRLFRRKYNQSALIAHYIARSAGLPCLPDALLRTRPTPSLGGKNALERREIMHNAIAVNPKRLASIANRRIILIDDVLTSGATANECCRALLQAGAASVDVLAAARVCVDR